MRAGAELVLMLVVAALTLMSCGDDDSGSQRQQAATYAKADVACQSDADCCAVFDACLATALLVSSADRSTVASLLASAPQDTCLACIPPAVQVRCEAKVCALYLVEGTGDFNALTPMMADHCGTLPLPAGFTETQQPAEDTSFSGTTYTVATVAGC